MCCSHSNLTGKWADNLSTHVTVTKFLCRCQESPLQFDDKNKADLNAAKQWPGCNSSTWIFWQPLFVSAPFQQNFQISLQHAGWINQIFSPPPPPYDALRTFETFSLCVCVLLLKETHRSDLLISKKIDNETGEEKEEEEAFSAPGDDMIMDECGLSTENIRPTSW